MGLDSDIKKLPQHLMGAEDPVYEFNKAIVDATADVAIAYKPNIAFYESNGVSGWITLEKTVKYIKSKYPEIFLIADAKGAFDFQFFEENGVKLYERVLRKSQEWGNDQNMMYVVGATKVEMLSGIREIVPNHFLLVPGVGAQGGSLEEVAKYGMNSHCGLIVNSSRGIIFADKTENFAVRAREEAVKLQQQMAGLLAAKGVI